MFYLIIFTFYKPAFCYGDAYIYLKTVDPSRYFQLKENIEKAVSGQKQFLNEKKWNDKTNRITFFMKVDKLDILIKSPKQPQSDTGLYINI